MIAGLKYQLPDVLVMYRSSPDQVINPTVVQIQAFDSGLFDDNNADIVEIMAEPEFNTMIKTAATPSRVLLYSRSGEGDLRDRIRSACRFCMNTQGF
jgi:hypothetical protein